MSDTINITKRPPLKGEDGSKVVSVRLKADLIARLDKLAQDSNRSRNEIIALLLEDGITRAKISE